VFTPNDFLDLGSRRSVYDRRTPDIIACPIRFSLGRRFKSCTWRRAFVWFAVLSTNLPGLYAQWSALPAHPTLLYAEYKGAQLPVVAASGEKPVVIIDGKRRALPSTTPLRAERAARYQPADVAFDVKILKRTHVSLRDMGGQELSAEEFKLSVTATANKEVPDCFLVMLCYNADALTDPSLPVSSSLRVRELGTLHPGTPTHLEFETRIVFPLRYADKPRAMGPEYILMETLWQVFSQGAEVRPDVSDKVAAFYYHREKSAQQIALAAWRRENANGNRPVQPLLQIPPLLEFPVATPTAVTATLSIAADGSVSHVSLDGNLPEQVQTLLSRTLGAWLFLPAIKDGVPIPTRVRIPLNL